MQTHSKFRILAKKNKFEDISQSHHTSSKDGDARSKF